MINIDDLNKRLEIIKQQAFNSIFEANNLQKLQILKSKYLGKNSYINNILKSLENFSSDLIIEIGKLINNFKKEINEYIINKFNKIEKEIIDKNLKFSKIDLTLPFVNFNLGHINPLFKSISEMTNIFKKIGYQVIIGHEVENEEYNFDRLNLQFDHPSRNMQDSFYFENNNNKLNRWLLRTHTTNMTARILSKQNKNLKNNIAIISFGNVYRKDDDDMTHSHQFMQFDGFLVGSNINFANLKWTLNFFCQNFFGIETKIRFRPSYFPFTEPSIELDISCSKCNIKKGCSLCKYTGWIEVLGAGMIHPNVFVSAGLNKNTTGFAFGIGIERITMIKYKINDIRIFYNNDFRFLKQF